MTDDALYEAMVARDPRFDGVFFVGVQTTGIYCRPICPARTPGRARCTFFPTPVQAEAAGFRACFRCRPELAPGGVNAANGRANAAVDAIDTLVTAATQRIAEGALNDGSIVPAPRSIEASQQSSLAPAKEDPELGHSIDDLATELGVTARHLRRAMKARLGVSPVELAQSRRVGIAKQLLQDTSLPITTIAFAAGFGSVRRFNAVFSARMGSAPTAVRRSGDAVVADAPVTLRLDYRPPYDWARLLAFLRGRAIPGVEQVGAASYRRIVHLAGHVGAIEVRAAPNRSALELELAPALLPVVMQLVARVRRMFDLDARPDLIDRALGRDRTLAPFVTARPGLRLPGAIDPFEAAIRAMLGQQVSVAAATTLAGRFAAQLGTRIATEPEASRVAADTAQPGTRIAEASRVAAESAQSGTRITKPAQLGTRVPSEPGRRVIAGAQVGVAREAARVGTRALAEVADAQHRVAAEPVQLAYRFPTPAEVAAAGADRIVKIGMPMTRARAIEALATAIATERVKLDTTCDLDAFVAALVALPGIGPWTAHYLAMRALHMPDAFPAADLGIQKALRRAGAKQAEARAEAWRPYRSYAVIHLWTQLTETSS